MTEIQDSRRDVVFLVASCAAEHVLRGLFGGSGDPGKRLGCGRFAFDPEEDVFVAPGRDQGVFSVAPELLSPFERLHRRAVVVLNANWPGSPGPARLAEDLNRRLVRTWDELAVIVIDPCLEAWVWQAPDVADVLSLPNDYREILVRSEHWKKDETHPKDPEGALDHLRRHHKVRAFSSDFTRVAEQMPVEHCKDPAFTLLCDRLRTWFPENT
ncbi:methylation-associated defense system protein MAD4 [Actinomadura madurae]|uniref:methylation-associated defense system protein MAD4 n=1 Tax=Actinomadura madurae TaxID=1993 RepID=UPI000D9C6949|nr:hypothetical protein [Actinomadura madurae]SPT60109.1 Uncharacterised protein [Actinomadura madurae]